jgi:hypothetical protein
VEVEAINYDMARKAVIEIFGKSWGWLYKEGEFDKKLFPGGKIGKTIYG